MADEEEDDIGGTGPSGMEARIAKVTYQRREARRERDEAVARVSELQAALAEREQQIQGFSELQTKLQSYEQMERGWAFEKAIMGAGITDPEGVDMARLAYQRLPEDSRPELTDWLADAEKLPKAVRVYMPGAEPQAAQAGTVNPDRGVRQSSGTAVGGDARGQELRNKESLSAAWERLGVSRQPWRK